MKTMIFYIQKVSKQHAGQRQETQKRTKRTHNSTIVIWKNNEKTSIKAARERHRPAANTGSTRPQRGVTTIHPIRRVRLLWCNREQK